MFQRLYTLLERLAAILLYIAGAIVVLQAVWISYGVIMRYVFNNPDGTVTEATALLLLPVAFLGLTYALKEDAYPKVTLLLERLPYKVSNVLVRFNFLIMSLIGMFFATAATKAMLKSISSGASSEILLWPRLYFWIPVMLSLIVFSLYAVLKLIQPKSKESQ